MDLFNMSCFLKINKRILRSKDDMSYYLLIIFILSILVGLSVSYVPSYNESDVSRSILVKAEEYPISLVSTNLYYAKTIYSDIKILRGYALDNRIIILGGVKNGQNIVRVISLRQDLSSASYVDYVVHGGVTYISTPDTQTGLIVVGTSLGEIAIIDLNLNKVTYIQASRNPIKSVYISSVRGSYYIVGFDGEFIYSYRYMAPGWLEIGPINSTALLGFMPASIIDVVPLIRVSSSLIAYDLSKIFLIYTPPKIKLVINVTDQYGQPINNAVVRLEYVNNKDLYYTAVTKNGSVSIDLPIPDVNGSYYLLKITHPSYETYAQIIYLHSPREVEETIYLTVSLKSGIGILEAAQPIIERSFLSIIELDLSQKPYKATQRGVMIIPSKIVKAYLFEPLENIYPYKYLVVLSSYDGIYIIYYDQNLNIIPVRGLNYIFYYYKINDPKTFNSLVASDGGYIITSFDDRLYLLRYETSLSQHVVASSYVFLGKVNSLSMSSDKKISVVTDDRMINIFHISDGLLKSCTRSNEYSGFESFTRPFYTYISVDGSYSVDVGDTGIYIIDTSRYDIDICPIEKIKINIVPEIQSIEEDYIGIYGQIFVKENNNLVATGMINNSKAELYLPSSKYDFTIESAQIGRVTYNNIMISPGVSRLNLYVKVYPIDLFVRVGLEKASISLPPIYAETGNDLIITNLATNLSTKISLRSNPLRIYLGDGIYNISLLYKDLIIATGSLKIDSPGPVFTDLVAKTYTLNINIVRSDDKSIINTSLLNITLLIRGPLWSGTSINIHSTSPLILPAGLYDVDITSRYYMSVTSRIELFNDLNKTIELTPTLFDLRVRLVDMLNRNVGKALIEFRNVRTGAVTVVETDQNGEALVKDVSYDLYNITIIPYNNNYFKTTRIIMLIDSLEKTLIVNDVMRDLTLRLNDKISGEIIAPLKISVYVDNISYKDLVVNRSDFVLTLPTGFVSLFIKPYDYSEKIYYSANISFLLDKNMSLSIDLYRIIYRLRFLINDLLGIPADGYTKIMSNETGKSVSEGYFREGVFETQIPYGDYMIFISSTKYLNKSISLSSEFFTNYTETLIYRITLDNIFVPLNIYIKDRANIPLKGSFIVEVSVLGRPYLRQIVNQSMFRVDVPKDYNISLKISPTEDNAKLYQIYSTDLGSISKETNYTAIINRKIYRITFNIYNDLGQPVAAQIILTNRENPTYTYEITVSQDGFGVTNVMAGDYILEVYGSGYNKYESSISIVEDSTRSITLYPSIPTLLLRFTPLFIGIGVIGIVIGIAWWLRRIILKRLEEEVI